MREMALVVFAVLSIVAPTAAQEATAPLDESLGQQHIETIAALGFVSFAANRAEKPILLERSFWQETVSRLSETIGPEAQPKAARFLAVGFSEFLDDFQSFLLEDEPASDVLHFNGRKVAEYAAHANCEGSPCKVPPCYGDSVTCWSCDL